MAQNVAGGAAKDDLSQSALCVGTLDQEVTAQCLRVREDHLACQATIKTVIESFSRQQVAAAPSKRSPSPLCHS